MAPYMESPKTEATPSSGEIPALSKEQTKSAPATVLAQQEATNGTNRPVPPHQTQWPEHEVPFFSQYALKPRPLRIITIGAGFSGLLIAHKLQHRFPEMQEFVSHTIFEQRSDIGGTWLVNTYPGVQCDVPSHIYAFPFDPNPEWSSFYAKGSEIHEYFKTTAKKWNLDRDLQLNTKVVSAYWQEDAGQWKLTVECDGQQRVEVCDILISGQGNLVEPSWPKGVTGLENFKGHITHSGRWDHDYDYSNKRIAVIGNGSSGIQIVPKMQALPGTTVRNFIRGPAWVYYRMPASKHLGRAVESTNPAYLDEEKERFRDPVKHREYRKGIIHRTNAAFKLVSPRTEDTHTQYSKV